MKRYKPYKFGENQEDIILNILDDAISRRLQSTSKEYKTNKELLDDTLDAGIFDNDLIRRKTTFKNFDFTNLRYFNMLVFYFYST